MQHCDKCNKDFYSDTEFEADKQFHQVSDFMERGMTSNTELRQAIGALIYELMAKGATDMMIAKGLPFEEAANLYLDCRKAIGPIAGQHNKKAFDQKYGLGKDA